MSVTTISVRRCLLLCCLLASAAAAAADADRAHGARAYAASLAPRPAADASPPPSPPVINSIRIVTPSLKMGKSPKSLRLEIDVTSTAGVSNVYADTRSRDFKQTRRRGTDLASLRKTGVITLDVTGFTTLTEPGDWDVRYVQVCDVNGACTTDDIFGVDPPPAGRSFTVVNSNAAFDASVPEAVSGEVLTSSIVTHSSGGPVEAKLKMGVRDAGSAGVFSMYICARAPGDVEEVCRFVDLPAIQKTANPTIPYSIWFYGNTHTPGVWHITSIEMIDAAGGNVWIGDPTQLDQIFPIGRAFSLTNGS